eukprot:TRINITY_DN64007_c0_g2_i1.p1 TRINITY_DN64007_c0_g2~~TRINITY_DN64007_c0_g2_i1.p1  ORF type:complete len:332 (+),score=24.41 TRINITY_DN64007_c0_g2_i1:118-996(+)
MANSNNHTPSSFSVHSTHTHTTATTTLSAGTQPAYNFTMSPPNTAQQVVPYPYRSATQTHADFKGKGKETGPRPTRRNSYQQVQGSVHSYAGSGSASTHSRTPTPPPVFNFPMTTNTGLMNTHPVIHDGGGTGRGSHTKQSTSSTWNNHPHTRLHRRSGATTAGPELPLKLEKQVPVILKWLHFIGVRPLPDLSTATWDDFCDGTLLCKIMCILHHIRSLPGVDQKPKTKAAMRVNIKKALKEVRESKKITCEWLWLDEDILQGKPESIAKFLVMLMKAYSCFVAPEERSVQ